MKTSIVLLAVLICGCATEHRQPVSQLGSLYIDCTNRTVYENFLNQQLYLTDFNKVEQNTEERRYYAAIKDRLWKLRSVCQ